MAEAEPNYGGAFVAKVTQDEIDAVYEKAAMKAADHHPAPGSYVPTMADILKTAAKEAEPEEEARFGGKCLPAHACPSPAYPQCVRWRHGGKHC